MATAVTLVVLAPNATASPTVASSRTIAPLALADTLTITITGLPDSASANVTVTGPDGFSQLVTASRTFADLAPGDYLIAATAVTVFGFRIVPEPATQVVHVTADSATLVRVTYAPAPSPQFPIGALLPGFHARQMNVMGSMYGYQIFVPQGYTPSQRWPVILFLHGSGERGSDNRIQLRLGIGPYVRDHAATFPAIVVFPQMPTTGREGSAGPSTIALMDLIATTALDRTLAEVRADSARIYITGLSLGAIRSWEIVYARPNLFAASVPIAGELCGFCLIGERPTTIAQGSAFAVRRLAALPIWVFHGGADGTVPAAADRTLVEVFRAAGSPIKYTEYPGVGHDAWGTAYHDPALWTWLFAQHR